MVITGWKSISTALGVSVRTAQNWRIASGLPVSNFTARTVFIERDRLEQWKREKESADVRSE